MNCDIYEYIQYVKSLEPVRLKDLIYYAYKRFIYLIKKVKSVILLQFKIAVLNLNMF